MFILATGKKPDCKWDSSNQADVRYFFSPSQYSLLFNFFLKFILSWLVPNKNPKWSKEGKKAGRSVRQSIFPHVSYNQHIEENKPNKQPNPTAQ